MQNNNMNLFFIAGFQTGFLNGKDRMIQETSEQDFLTSNINHHFIINPCYHKGTET